MSGFDPEWLALREPADRRARNAGLASALSAHFALREAVRVVDLGCGTGSNLRALAELLPAAQSWVLVDHDPVLLDAARGALTAWAETAEETGAGDLLLKARGRSLAVSFRQFDLNDDLALVLEPRPDLVTAAAFFDLASPAFIRRTAEAVAARRAVFYTVLTYNGIQRFTPRMPFDQQVTAAFNRHQMSDKGLGTSAGPTAPAHLADQFRIAGYSVQEGDSPWLLDSPRDGQLIAELVRGGAGAVAETGLVDVKTITRFAEFARKGAEIGHTDTLAIPA